MSAAYEPPGSRATPAILALYVLIGAWALTIGADVRRIVVAHGYGRDGLDDSLQSADQLVRATTLLAAVVVVVAVVLFARWAVVARRNDGVLAARGPATRPAVRRLRIWALAIALAVAAVLVTTLGFGEAADIADRERIDASTAGASLLALIATGLTIALVSRTTREQDVAAQATDVPRAPSAPAPAAERVSDGGTRVVSEEQARRERPGS